jgi:hypothetical protein
MNTNINNLKARWQSFSLPNATAAESDNTASQVLAGKITSPLQDVITKTRQWAIIAFLLAPVQLCYMFFPEWLKICMMVFFLICGVRFLIELRAAQRVDLGRLNVVEALKRVIALKRTRYWGKVVCILLAVPMLVEMFMMFASESVSMVLGGVCGLITGAVIGFLMDAPLRHQIRTLERLLLEASDNSQSF